MSDLPKFVDVDEDTRLAGVPLARTDDLQYAKRRFGECRSPIAVPSGKYVRVAHDQNAAILELARFNCPWAPRVSWVVRTRHLLPRRMLYSPELPIEVSPQDLLRPCVHPEAPSHLASVWHYMDDWKFQHMLKTSAIFLARADLVSDCFEGTVSLANLRWRADVYRHRYRRMAQRHSFVVRELANIKRWTYLSCWRVDEGECSQAWRSYLTGCNGVAIKVRYRRLLEPTSTIFCAGVEYIDYDRDWVVETNPLLPFTYKHTEWGWEREFRIIIQRFPHAKLGFDDALYYDCAAENRNCGITLRVDLNRLIDRIVVAPQADGGYAEEVLQHCAQLGLADRVEHSVLSEQQSQQCRTTPSS